MADIHIGSKVWTHDRYPRRGDSAAIEFEVTGETRMSWLIKAGWREYKLPKKECLTKDYISIKVSNRGAVHQTFYLTQKALEDERWLGRNKYWLSNHINHTSNLTADVLREVAKLVGYVEKGDDNG